MAAVAAAIQGPRLNGRENSRSRNDPSCVTLVCVTCKNSYRPSPVDRSFDLKNIVFSFGQTRPVFRNDCLSFYRTPLSGPRCRRSKTFSVTYDSCRPALETLQHLARILIASD